MNPPRPLPGYKNFLNDWLQGVPDARHTTFRCTLLSEIGGSRPAIRQALGEAVFVHHNDPDAYRAKLAHLGFPATGAALDRRPRSEKTRTGNFGEIIASEFLRQVRGYSIPVYRLRYNGNDESSPKGDDVLAFEFADRARGVKDTVIVAEVKVRGAFRSDAVDEAHEALLRGHRPRPKSFLFVVDMLFREGRTDEWQRLLDLSSKFGKRSLTKRSVLFLVTGNRPADPFGDLGRKKKVAPNLEALHLPLDELGGLVTSTFETHVDAHTL